MIIDISHESKIQKVWEMDRKAYDEIKSRKDDEGVYLWTPDLKYPEKNGELLGCGIQIVDEPGIRLVLVYRQTANTKLVTVT